MFSITTQKVSSRSKGISAPLYKESPGEEEEVCLDVFVFQWLEIVHCVTTVVWLRRSSIGYFFTGWLVSLGSQESSGSWEKVTSLLATSNSMENPHRKMENIRYQS